MTQGLKSEQDRDWAYWLGCAGGIILTLLTVACFIGAIVVYFFYGEKLSSLPFGLSQPTPLPPVDFVTQVDKAEWKLSLSDGFSSNENNWEASNYQEDGIDMVRSISDGVYRWEIETNAPYLFWDFPDQDPLGDVIISADFKVTEGNSFDSFGMILRATGSSYYFFEINTGGMYSFLMNRNEEWTTIFEHKYTGYVLPDAYNQIAVQAQGSHFKFFVNGRQIDEAQDATLRSGYNGILLSPAGADYYFLVTPGANGTTTPEQKPRKSSYEVDNFKLWTPAKVSLKGYDPLTPEPGRILFTSDVDGNLELYSIQTDAANQQRLTNDPAADYDGKWSPDGKQIVFVSERDGNPELYLMQADGSSPARLTNEPSVDNTPSWSPDGKQIVFSSQRDGNAELYLYTLASQQVERLTDSPAEDSHPAWSPDGKSILFQSGLSGIASIHQLHIASGTVEQLTHSETSIGTAPSWSPDGNRFAYVLSYMGLRSELIIVDAATSDTSHIAFGNEKNNWPAWSPDGGQIVFISNISGQQDIFIVSADSKNLHQLTNDKAVESYLDWTSLP